MYCTAHSVLLSLTRTFRKYQFLGQSEQCSLGPCNSGQEQKQRKGSLGKLEIDKDKKQKFRGQFEFGTKLLVIGSFHFLCLSPIIRFWDLRFYSIALFPGHPLRFVDELNIWFKFLINHFINWILLLIYFLVYSCPWRKTIIYIKIKFPTCTGLRLVD